MLLTAVAQAVVSGSVLAGAVGQPEVNRPDPSAEFQERYGVIAREGQPETGANALELINPLADRIRAVTGEAIRKKFPETNPAEVDLQALTRSEGLEPIELEKARVALEGLIKSDVPKLTAEMAAAPRSVKGEGSGLLLMQQLPHLGKFRQVARFQSGRMTLAQERDDAKEWLTAFDETMRIGQQVSEEPVLISALVGIAIQALAMESAQRYIAAGCDDAMLAKMAEVVRSRPLSGFDKALRGEELLATDALEYVYDVGPEGVKFIRDGTGEAPARPAKPVLPDDQPIGPGMPSLIEHRKIFADHYENLRAVMKMPKKERESSKIAGELGRDEKASLLLGILAPAYGKAASSWDLLQAERIGLLTIIGLERFRIANGSYPATLGELSGVMNGEAMTDPYTSQPLGYLAPSKGPYEGGRGYVLYAAGVNGADDGGNVDFENPQSANRSDGGGDLLLNRHAPGKK